MTNGNPYELHPRPDGDVAFSADVGGVRVVFGAGSLDELGERTRELGIERPLVVTDAGIVAAGHVERGVEALRRAGLDAAVFDGVEENPTTEHVARGVEAARAHGADSLIGLGGGSSMDCAKGVNFLLSNGGEMEDYWGVGKATKPMLPSLGVPTTAGTGSEAQRFALISQATTHRKMACGDRKARFRTVLLDPDLLATVPQEVASVAGLDAVSHALETYVSRRRNPISQLYSREAWRRIESSFETYLKDRGDRRARSFMLLGSHLAGAAIEASMLGAAHSLANPLTARYGVTHGIAVGLMLPHVIRFNGVQVEELYRDLVHVAGRNGTAKPDEGDPHRGTKRLSARVGELLQAAGTPRSLGECGVEPAALAELAEQASQEWTARFNPRRAVREDFQKLYESAL